MCGGTAEGYHQSTGEHLTSEPLHGPRQMKNSEWCCKNVCLWFCWRRNLGYFNCHLHTSRYAVVQNYCTGAFMSSDVWMERRMLICSVQFKSRTLAFLHACALVPISPWHCEDFFLCSCSWAKVASVCVCWMSVWIEFQQSFLALVHCGMYYAVPRRNWALSWLHHSKIELWAEITSQQDITRQDRRWSIDGSKMGLGVVHTVLFGPC